MSNKARIGIVLAIFFGGPFLVSQWQSYRSTNDSSTRDDSGEIVESGTLGVLIVRVGDCVLIPSSWRDKKDAVDDVVMVSQVEGIPCTELHDAEVVGEINSVDLGFPGETVLFERMENFCVNLYESYTGASYMKSPHVVLPLVPTSTSWAQGDRKSQCFALNIEDKQLGASIRG